MHQKTVDLGHYFNGQEEDYMVGQMEARKCSLVENKGLVLCWKLKILFSSIFQDVCPECHEM